MQGWNLFQSKILYAVTVSMEEKYSSNQLPFKINQTGCVGIRGLWALIENGLTEKERVFNCA